MTKLTAYTHSGRTWEKEVTIYFEGPPQLPRLSFGYPMEYSLNTDFVEGISTGPSRELCIDSMGRNHGVQEAVYVNCGEVLDFLRSERVI